LPAGSADEVNIQFTFECNTPEAAKQIAPVPADLVGPVERMTDRQLDLILAEHSMSGQLAAEKKKSGDTSQATMAINAKLLDCLIEERKFAEVQKILDPLLAHYNDGAHADACFAQLLRIAGDLALEQHNKTEADSNYQQSIKVAEELGSVGSTQLQESLQAYAKYLYKQGDYHKSNEIYERIRLMLLR
jgi:tetratricopeptide (TPR) repeat protein